MPTIQSLVQHTGVVIGRARCTVALRRVHAGLAAMVVAVLQACGGDAGPAVRSAAADAADGPSASKGQVAAVPTYKVSYYAAARFADQVSFGATPALLEDIRAKGFEAWIDAQMALPHVAYNTSLLEGYRDPVPESYNSNVREQILGRMVAAPDQLRQRVTWGLSQWVVAAYTKGEHAGWLHWASLLDRNAFGNYRTLLRDVSLNPHMGHYLDNDQNRPKSEECQHCAPNENYARELMQLFSIGVNKLEADGTPVRDARGRFVETYTQRDVEELARVLTGWTHDPNPPNRPQKNWGNWAKPMVASTWPPERDSGRKVVMGREFPAGQSTSKDLDDAIDLLMSHPNIAPFVALRVIQHLVKSDPSPAYVGRVALKFRDNGQGTKGDMKAVVKAALLDAEARRGDDPSKVQPLDGKFREPVLHRVAAVRGLGCTKMPLVAWGNILEPQSQRPYSPESVFSFYAPTDRAPGSNLLAPEQKLATANEFTGRLGELTWLRRNGADQGPTWSGFTEAGCSLDSFSRAFERSPREFLDLVSQRWFRGAMPPTLRSALELQIKRPTWWPRDDPAQGAISIIGVALASPYYGVIK